MDIDYDKIVVLIFLNSTSLSVECHVFCIV